MSTVISEFNSAVHDFDNDPNTDSENKYLENAYAMLAIFGDDITISYADNSDPNNYQPLEKNGTSVAFKTC